MQLHEILHLERPLIVFDTETTGTDPEVDRICELGFQVWDATGMTAEWRSLIVPGVPISAEAQAAHGITNEMVNPAMCRHCGRSGALHPFAEMPAGTAPEGSRKLTDEEKAMNGGCPAYSPMPTFQQIAPRIAAGFSNCDFAGKNIRFDIRITMAEMRRYNTPWSIAGARIIDIERLEQIACPRNLSALHEKYTGQKFEGAHTALADVRASVTVLEHQFLAHPQLPRDLQALHELQFPGMIDIEGKFKFVDGVPRLGNWGKYKNKRMDEVPLDYWNFILKSDFSPEIKDIARDARRRVFPEQRKLFT